MEDKIHDLDVLRPKAEYVKLAGKQIDISFIPSGVALDLMELRQELEEMSNTPDKLEEIEKGGEAAKKSFEVAAELCAKITQNQHEEMTREWLLKNTNVQQMKALVEHVTNAVFGSLGGGEDDANPPAGQ
jgi:hypothetical protein